MSRLIERWPRTVLFIGALVAIVFCRWMADLAAPHDRMGQKILFLVFMAIALALFIGAFALERRWRGWRRRLGGAFDDVRIGMKWPDGHVEKQDHIGQRKRD
jgi:hypothetical protein